MYVRLHVVCIYFNINFNLIKTKSDFLIRFLKKKSRRIRDVDVFVRLSENIFKK